MKLSTVTDEEFEQFKNHIKTYSNKLGLIDWDIRIEFEKLNSEIEAQTQTNFNAKQAYITLNKKRLRHHTIEFTALHEVLEVLLNEMNFMATFTFRETFVNEVRHEVINRLVNCMINGEGE